MWALRRDGALSETWGKNALSFLPKIWILFRCSLVHCQRSMHLRIPPYYSSFCRKQFFRRYWCELCGCGGGFVCGRPKEHLKNLAFALSKEARARISLITGAISPAGTPACKCYVLMIEFGGRNSFSSLVTYQESRATALQVLMIIVVKCYWSRKVGHQKSYQLKNGGSDQLNKRSGRLSRWYN